MLCSKQTMDLLKPDNDTVTLGYSYGTFTGANVKLGASVSTLGKTMSSIKQEADSIVATVEAQGQSLSKLELLPGQLTLSVTNNATNTGASIQLVAGTKEDGTPNTLGSPAEIKLTGLVTFESLGENGTTKIDGSRITTGTISADRINLRGKLVFEDFTEETQEEFMTGDAVGTLITNKLVSSPTIRGGAYYDTSYAGRLLLSLRSSSPILTYSAYLGDETKLEDRAESDYLSLFRIVPVGDEVDSVALTMLNDRTVFTVYKNGKISPGSGWDFSGVTATAVFG